MKKYLLLLLVCTFILDLSGKVLKAENFDCTRIERVPTVIKYPGHYCLEKDFYLNMSQGAAIAINTNNVVLDLNGHVLDNRAAGATTLAFGISTASRIRVEIRNGTVFGFHTGISARSDGGRGSSVDIHHLRVVGSYHTGIEVSTYASSVHNCQILSTGTDGSTESLVSGIVVGVENYSGNLSLPGGITVTENEILRFVPDGYETGYTFVPPYYWEPYFTVNTPSAGIEIRNISSAIIEKNRIVVAKYGVAFSNARVPSVVIGSNIMHVVETTIKE